ncbi:MAG: hypothetical protein HY318_00990 [Armatimonadetes bacterium]|nr:hypothetical protein [Armatimonadota bacterium]
MFDLLPLVEAIKQKPITRVWVWSALKEPFSVPKSDLVIDPQWKYGDACVKVAGCDVNALPPSGVLGTASYWMLVEETVSRLAPG